MKKKPSFLFGPYKALGVHTTAVKPVFFNNTGRKKPYVSLYCPINNTLTEYNAGRLRLITTSDCLPADITAVAVKNCEANERVYAAAGETIYTFTFCRNVDRKIPLKCFVKHMIVLGDQLVTFGYDFSYSFFWIIVDFDDGLRVIDIESGQETLHLEGTSSFQVTSIIHPATYLNKVVLGSSKGSLKIVNIRTGKVIHIFEKLIEGSIDVLEQTPVADILALGGSNGVISLHNIKTDDQLVEFRHDKAVSAIGFRTDGLPFMTTADIDGNIAVWDLDKQELVGKISNVHKGPVTKLYFFPREPVMVSTSADNSIRVWVLDSGDAIPRQLNILEGHSAPASAATFASKTEVITASLDGSIRKHSIVLNAMRVKLGDAGVMSRAEAKKKHRSLDTIKIDPVVDISIGFSREAAWDNILCRHNNSLIVSTWTSGKTKMGKHKLIHPRFKTDSAMFHAIATSTCVSTCGNFAFIGYSTGHVDQFNIQSGRLIKSFGEETTNEDGKEKKIGKAHTAAVTALSVDIRGSELVTGSTAGELKFWNIRKGNCTTTMKTRLQIHGCAQSPVSSLIALKCSGSEGPSVAIVDVLCRRVVRTFKQVGKELNGITFSSDGKWLLTADNSCFVRVWDLPTSNLIDVLLFSKPCIGMCFNETGQYLATVHEGERSIQIWVNKKLLFAQLNIKPLPVDFTPSWDFSMNNDYNLAQLDLPDEDEDMDEESTVIDEDLVTYSGLPPSRWANLPDLALIKERNKPKEAPRKPKQAPFFLTAAATLEGFEFETPKEEGDEERKSIQAKRSLLELESSFSSSLRKARTVEEFLAAFDQLKTMSLSAIDFQLHSLPAEVLPQFFKMLQEKLKTRKEYDLVQAYLASAIKIHRATLWSSDSPAALDSVIEELSEEIERSWKPFEEVMTENAAIIQWVKNALL